MIAGRKLIVNADDFGFTRDVNDGIVQAHTRGILTATTLMANGPAFDHAVELARRTPSLDIGCHLVLVGGHSLLPGQRPYPLTVKSLIAEMTRGRISIEDELEPQVARIVNAGLRPTHLDTHKHTHLLPPVLSVVARLGRKYGIPWVRRPFDFPVQAGTVPVTRRLISRSLHFLRRRFHDVLESNGCRTTDNFAGFSVTGYLRIPELMEVLRKLPAGSTEFMTHPGICGAELRGARTRLKESREKELEALTDGRTREILDSEGIELTNYRSLTVAVL